MSWPSVAWVSCLPEGLKGVALRNSQFHRVCSLVSETFWHFRNDFFWRFSEVNLWMLEKLHNHSKQFDGSKVFVISAHMLVRCVEICETTHLKKHVNICYTYIYMIIIYVWTWNYKHQKKTNLQKPTKNKRQEYHEKLRPKPEELLRPISKLGSGCCDLNVAVVESPQFVGDSCWYF